MQRVGAGAAGGAAPTRFPFEALLTNRTVRNPVRVVVFALAVGVSWAGCLAPDAPPATPPASSGEDPPPTTSPASSGDVRLLGLLQPATISPGERATAYYNITNEGPTVAYQDRYAACSSDQRVVHRFLDIELRNSSGAEQFYRGQDEGPCMGPLATAEPLAPGETISTSFDWLGRTYPPANGDSSDDVPGPARPGQYWIEASFGFSTGSHTRAVALRLAVNVTAPAS